MPSIGKETFLVKEIHRKTKIRTEDIAEILNLLPECLAEAFFQANPAEKEGVNFGAVIAHWKNTNLGPGIFFKPSKTFNKHTLVVKYKQNTPLATLLFEKMLPFNRKSAVKFIESNTQNIDSK